MVHVWLQQRWCSAVVWRRCARRHHQAACLQAHQARPAAARATPSSMPGAATAGAVAAGPGPQAAADAVRAEPAAAPAGAGGKRAAWPILREGDGGREVRRRCLTGGGGACASCISTVDLVSRNPAGQAWLTTAAPPLAQTPAGCAELRACAVCAGCAGALAADCAEPQRILLPRGRAPVVAVWGHNLQRAHHVPGAQLAACGSPCSMSGVCVPASQLWDS